MMKTTPEALKDLYIALGGEASVVQGMSLTVDVLNALATKYEGEGDASVIPDALENIVAVADNIGGSQVSGTKTITANGTYDVAEYESAEVNVPKVTLDDAYSITIENTTGGKVTIGTTFVDFDGSIDGYKLSSGRYDLANNATRNLRIFKDALGYAILSVFNTATNGNGIAFDGIGDDDVVVYPNSVYTSAILTLKSAPEGTIIIKVKE